MIRMGQNSIRFIKVMIFLIIEIKSQLKTWKMLSLTKHKTSPVIHNTFFSCNAFMPLRRLAFLLPSLQIASSHVPKRLHSAYDRNDR